MDITKKRARALIQKFASDRKRAASAQSSRGPIGRTAAAGGKRFGFTLDQTLRAGLLTTPDPNASGIIPLELKGRAYCELTVGADPETRTLPAASGHPVGLELTIILRHTAGGTATIEGLDTGTIILSADGDLATCIVSIAGNTKIWKFAYGTVV